VTPFASAPNDFAAVTLHAGGNILFSDQPSGGTLQIGAVGGGTIAGIGGITAPAGAKVTLSSTGTITQDLDAANAINVHR